MLVFRQLELLGPIGDDWNFEGCELSAAEIMQDIEDRKIILKHEYTVRSRALNYYQINRQSRSAAKSMGLVQMAYCPCGWKQRQEYVDPSRQSCNDC